MYDICMIIIFFWFCRSSYIVLNFYNPGNEQGAQSRGTVVVNGEYFNRIASWPDTSRTIMYPIRTDRILIRVTSASKRIFLPRVEEAHEFAPGYMSRRDGLKNSRCSFMAG